MTTGVDLIIFDCDGILVDSEPIALRINATMLAELGWTLTDDDIIDRFLGRSMTSNLAQIEDHLGHPIPTDWATRFATAITAAHNAELTTVDGIADALDAIDKLAIPTCVASSGTPDKIRHSLTLVGLHDRFDGHIFSATQVAHGKPAPDLFLHAAHTMNTDPARCIVVEDSQYGVTAARAAGMRALGYAGGLTPAAWLEGADTTVFTDMRQIPDLIRDNAA